jgi:hypothetical protein
MIVLKDRETARSMGLILVACGGSDSVRGSADILLPLGLSVIHRGRILSMLIQNVLVNYASNDS